MKNRLFSLVIILAQITTSSEIARSAEFHVKNEQYDRLLNMMQTNGIMLPYKKSCEVDKSGYICTIRADEVVIVTYAADATSNLTAVTFAAKSKSLERVSSLAAVASLSLNRKFVQLNDQSKGETMMKSEKIKIEQTLMGLIVRGGSPSMELTPGGERFYYEVESGQAAVRVAPRDWK